MSTPHPAISVQAVSKRFRGQEQTAREALAALLPGSQMPTGATPHR